MIELEALQVLGNDYTNNEVSAIPSSSSLYLNKIIEYADKYVIHDISSGDPGTVHSSYYNPNYQYYPENDCANFVSQCLYAGGLGDTTTWCAGSSKWKSVSGVISRLGGNDSLTAITSNAGNAYPGNPIITKNKGHIAICVGYNSAGRAVINGHTRDVYHQPLYNGTGDTSYYYTIKLFSSNKMGSKPTDATQITPNSSYQYVGTVDIGKNKSKYYKFYTTTAGTYTFRFNNASSDKKMYAVLYRKKYSSSHGEDVGLYQVQKHSSTTNTPVLFNMTITSKSIGRWYYIRFYHKYSNTYGLNFSYKFN